MKALNEDCVRFEIFPPGHLYSSAAGGFRRWYTPHWFQEQVPRTPYQPLVLREAFEKVRACVYSSSGQACSVVLVASQTTTAATDTDLAMCPCCAAGGYQEAHD